MQSGKQSESGRSQNTSMANAITKNIDRASERIELAKRMNMLCDGIDDRGKQRLDKLMGEVDKIAPHVEALNDKNDEERQELLEVMIREDEDDIHIPSEQPVGDDVETQSAYLYNEGDQKRMEELNENLKGYMRGDFGVGDGKSHHPDMS